MKFSETLNEYIETLGCTAKDISGVSGLSEATISRYRTGGRVPETDSEAFEQLCEAIALLAERKQLRDITKASVKESFFDCTDLVIADKEQLRENFNTLISVLDINISKLCRHTNYDTSTIFRFRNGSRHPSEPTKFAAAVAGYVSREMNSAGEISVLAELLGCSSEELSDSSKRFDKIQSWLLEGKGTRTDSLSKFLTKLDEFDLTEYIKAIHFDELKVPSFPFQLPTSKTYFGLKEMMESELDFLKATVLSKSMAPVIMYSDMPMGEMAKDPEFPKKWMFGMAMMLKKGLHLNQIHNLDRSFEDMMLGLESWIPMYMTGQISPYYLKNVQNNVFLHFLKVSGTAALSGEAISGYHSEGKYYLTKSREEVSYYQKRAQELLASAHPLMEIYREENADALNAFLIQDAHTEGKRRSILSALPIYTMDKDYLEQFLAKQTLSEAERERILSYADSQRQLMEEILKTDLVEDEIPQITPEEFERYPIPLSLSGMFSEKEIFYTYEDYTEHLNQTKIYAETHPNYILNQTSVHTFRNLQIYIHEGKWAMVSKNKTPVIHFVIHHPRLRDAIENFIPPVVETD
ncbi:MAG: helix-turn-helix domain-containing protein [Oscillospiraceae bacterium]